MNERRMAWRVSRRDDKLQVMSVEHQPLRGKRVVVAGGTSGTGFGDVRAAAEAGAEVVAAGPRPPAERPDGRGNVDRYVTGTVLEVSEGEPLVALDL